MATEVWCYIDGQKVEIPFAPYEAEQLGWHKGAEFKSPIHIDDTKGAEVDAWCRKTFDPYVYRVFIRSAWFLREQDAMLCKLRWSC